MRNELTDRQQEILSIIVSETDLCGPTIRGPMRSAGLNSTNAAVGHLKALEKKGAIECEQHSARGIRIVDPSLVDGMTVEVGDVLFELRRKK